MEPRNNVSITFDISRGAADKLKQLIDKDENVLKNLGILTVHFNNGPLAKVSQPASSVTQKTTTDNSPVAGTSSSNECTASSSASNVAQLDELLQTAQKVSVSNLSATQSANGEFDLNSSRRLLAQFLGQSPLKREITGTSANVNGPPFKLNAIAAQKTEVSSLLSTASSVRSSQTPSTDSIPIVQLTSTSNVTQSPCTTQSSPLPVGKINSLSFANVQYTVHPKPMQPGTYTLSTGNTIVATSACPTVQSALGGVPAAMTTSNSAPSTSIQSSHVNHPNHHPHIVSLQNNKFHIHPLTSSQITPSSSSSAITSPSSATNTQQITLNCQRFATPQQVLHQQLNRSPTIQMAPIGHNSLNHKSPPRVSTPNHTVFAVGSPSIKAPYIRNPNVGSNIRIGLQSLPPELMSKDTRQLNLPSNTIVTVTAGSTCNSISFPTSASGSNLNSINLPTSTRLGNESPGSTTSSNNSSSSTSNVALTSPLLVNLLQSEVSCDTSSMNSNHGCNSSIVTVPISSSAMLHSAFGSSNTVANVTVNHSMVMQPPPTASGLKEPIVKKAKIKKSRKPKDKPPDYEMKPATNNGSAVSSVTTFVTSASTTGRKISPSELYQSQ